MAHDPRRLDFGAHAFSTRPSQQTLERILLKWNQRKRRTRSAPSPSELGFTRVRHLNRPKSDKSDFGWERGGVRG
jgi:hypothetical protein